MGDKVVSAVEVMLFAGLRAVGVSTLPPYLESFLVHTLDVSLAIILCREAFSLSYTQQLGKERV